MPGIPLIVDVIDPIHRRTRRHVNPLRGGEERYQEIVLRPGGALRMRAVDELETPLPGARVVAYHQVGDSWLAAASAMTDTKGEATLRGLKAGVHAVTCVGWNLSGTDLYVIQDVKSVVPGDVQDLGVFKPTAPYLELELSSDGGGNDGARVGLASLTQLEDAVGHPVFERTSKFRLPFGRKVRLWVNGPGGYQLECRPTVSGSMMPDARFNPLGETLQVPGYYLLEFHKRGDVSEDGLEVEFSLPAMPKCTEHDNYMLIGMGGVTIAVLANLCASAPSTRRFQVPADGEYEVSGVLAGIQYEGRIFLNPSTAVGTDDLLSWEAGPSSVRNFSLVWDTTGEAFTGVVRAFTRDERPLQVLTKQVSEGSFNMETPDTLDLRIQCLGKYGVGNVLLSAGAYDGEVLRIRVD